MGFFLCGMAEPVKLAFVSSGGCAFKILLERLLFKCRVDAQPSLAGAIEKQVHKPQAHNSRFYLWGTRYGDE